MIDPYLLDLNEVAIECAVRNIPFKGANAGASLPELSKMLEQENEGNLEAPKNSHAAASKNPKRELEILDSKIRDICSLLQKTLFEPEFNKQNLLVGSTRLSHVYWRLRRIGNSPTYGAQALQRLAECEEIIDNIQKFLSNEIPKDQLQQVISNIYQIQVISFQRDQEGDVEVENRNTEKGTTNVNPEVLSIPHNVESIVLDFDNEETDSRTSGEQISSAVPFTSSTIPSMSNAKKQTVQSNTNSVRFQPSTSHDYTPHSFANTSNYDHTSSQFNHTYNQSFCSQSITTGVHTHTSHSRNIIPPCQSNTKPVAQCTSAMAHSASLLHPNTSHEINTINYSIPNSHYNYLSTITPQISASQTMMRSPYPPSIHPVPHTPMFYHGIPNHGSYSTTHSMPVNFHTPLYTYNTPNPIPSINITPTQSLEPHITQNSNHCQCTNSHFRSEHDNNYKISPSRNKPVGSYMHTWNLFFDGNPNHLSIGKFIFRVEHLAKTNDISLIALVDNLHFLLRGVALEWYWMVLPKLFPKNWNQLKQELFDRFQDRRTDFDIRHDIDSRKQKPNESFLDFYHSILNLAIPLQNQFSDFDLMNILRKNMKRSLRIAVIAKNFKNLNHFISKCVSFEDEWLRLGLNPEGSYQPRRVVNEMKSLVNEEDFENMEEEVQICELKRNLSKPSSSYKCWNCLQIGHTFKNCEIPPKTIFCYGCGLNGVLKPNCRNCHLKKNSGNLKRGLVQTGNQFPMSSNHQTPSTSKVDVACNVDPELRRMQNRN